MNSDHPRVLRRLAGVAVGVPDPPSTASFLADGLGFSINEVADRLEVLCAGDYGDDRPQAALSLMVRPAFELLELRFELEASADPDLLAKAIGRHGGNVQPPCREAGLRFRDPNGVAVALLPATDGEPGKRAGKQAALPASGLRPRRLGHANLKVADLAAASRFWVRALGMWVSEQIGEDLAFLRYAAEHHNLGLRTAADTSLHHLGFEVPGWDSYRPILDHLHGAGYAVEFGPGRHAVGRNLFTYLRDPSSGLRLELFSDMARVDHQVDPEDPPIRWRAEDRMTRTLNVWGSAPPPASFLE